MIIMLLYILYKTGCKTEGKSDLTLDLLISVTCVLFLHHVGLLMTMNV